LTLFQDAEGGHYELYQIPKDGKASENAESKRGLGVCAVFVGRKRFAVLDKSHQVGENCPI
jgi:coatomer protein complex subunit alpha (xenin)